MGKAIGAVFGLAVLGAFGLLVYGYSVDMAPAPSPQSQSVVLDAQ